MGKVLIWIVIVFAVLFVLRLINVAKSSRKPRDAAPPDSPGNAVMVQCAECGVYLPQAEAQRGPRGPCCGDDACRERAARSR
ncbi:MAG: PP0621 family protein [Casimicrobiaceae bacterium]